jgi:hypothetical protein
MDEEAPVPPFPPPRKRGRGRGERGKWHENQPTALSLALSRKRERGLVRCCYNVLAGFLLFALPRKAWERAKPEGHFVPYSFLVSS